ncbi:putative short chain dehydrogenase [Lyophyllum shimeji]|uniref:Short chain dehydrogenase n=1 Tax=Lyophyllum shimeji TaxID=47721 RepID=A0A9P3PM38_LYOSH|nr:putative short chain dehydrogenase [Lyophyllum shimeji]
MVFVFHTFADVPAIFSGLGPFLAQAYLCGQPHWTEEQIPDQSGRTIIITGGNAGVGKECAKALLQHNANVYLACRNRSRAEAAIMELRDLTGREAKFLPLDLADLNSVRDAVEEFTRNETELHILFNNAGVMFPPMEEEIDGYDAQIHINVLGHFYLTKLLLPVLLSTARGPIKPRILHVSSSGHYLAGSQPLDFQSFKCGPARRRRITEEMYIQSKFANIVVSNEFARRYGDQGLVFTSVNPGNLQTDLNRHVKNIFKRLLLRFLQIYPAKLGAVTQLWAGTASEAANLNGKFLVPWARVASPRPEAEDPRLGRDLWEWMEEQVNEWIQCGRPASRSKCTQHVSGPSCHRVDLNRSRGLSKRPRAENAPERLWSSIASASADTGPEPRSSFQSLPLVTVGISLRAQQIQGFLYTEQSLVLHDYVFRLLFCAQFRLTPSTDLNDYSTASVRVHHRQHVSIFEQTFPKSPRFSDVNVAKNLWHRSKGLRNRISAAVLTSKVSRGGPASVARAIPHI